MTETIVVDTSQFTQKIAPDIIVGFGGVPMVARCPDPYALSVFDDDGEDVDSAPAGRNKIREFLSTILSTEDAGRVEAMMKDAANQDVTLLSVRGLIDWLMQSPDGPEWGKAVREYAESMAAGEGGNRSQRRIAVKKTPAAKKAAAKKVTAARRAAAVKKTPAAK